jgi:catechol 2,3-dioxygenase-like lactoylglutathione lyase family enzyme/8-oxo-dGTP pyrophosphatase MutT (NUDIX family)
MIDPSWYERDAKSPTKISAGGVIARAENNQVLIALAQQKGVEGFVLPKGGIDFGEDLEQAALREIEEEAGFCELTFLDKLGACERYNRSKTHWKTTHYFLFRTAEVDVTPIEIDRHPPPKWFSIDDDMSMIFWPEQRKLIEDNRERITRLVRDTHDKDHLLRQVDHVNIVVRDIDEMVAFYRDVLGMEVTRDVTISGDWIGKVVGLKNVKARVVYLGLMAGPRIELIKYDKPKAKNPDHTEKPHALGMRHIAFLVRDIDKTVKRLAKAGVRFLSDVQDVPSAQVTYDNDHRKRLVYFHDPEGNLLELCEYR